MQTTNANGKYIDAGYVDFLNRLPTSGEMASWISYFNGGGSRAGFASAVANSPEWVSHVVSGFYYDTLGRPPDSQGLRYWDNQIITHAMTAAQVAAQLYASPEDFSTSGHNDLRTWVTDLYTKILDRTPDAAGLNYWVGVATNSGRATAAYNLYQSAESREDRVDVLYEELLERTPDVGGRAYWANLITTQGDVALAANLAASNEYYTDAQTRF